MTAAAGEFDLIRRYFSRPVRRAVLGGGDDCALLAPTPGSHWAVSSDMLVSGRHFFPDVDPRSLGHKALAVNLSDLAACGASPRAFTLALALPAMDSAWLQAFAQGLYDLAEAHDIELVGGDTTRGPLNLCLTVMGEVPAGQALLRSGAQVGDDLWVSGELGDAHLALRALLGEWPLEAAALTAVRQRLEWPQPRVALGQGLRGLATAAMDLSDGLLGDLGHLLERSRVGVRLHWDALPRSAHLHHQPVERQLRAVLGGGDDYELLFTVPSGQRARVEALSAQLGLSLHRVGEVVEGRELTVCDDQGRPMPLEGLSSFDHFAPQAGS